VILTEIYQRITAIKIYRKSKLWISHRTAKILTKIAPESNTLSFDPTALFVSLQKVFCG
jgi:hypothetical protein